jgi:hypothetical protein
MSRDVTLAARVLRGRAVGISASARGRDTHKRSQFGDLRRGLLSAALGMAAYYGARALGASPLDALLLGTVISAARVAYSALKDRRFDPIACFLMLANGITVTVGLATQSPVMTMLGQHIPGVVFELSVLGGLAMNRPITESIVSWIRPGWVEQHLAEHAWTEADARAYHRMHIRLSLAVAILQILHLTAAVLVIFSLPVDIAKGVLGILALSTDIAVLAVALGGIGRFLMRHKKAGAQQPGATSSQHIRSSAP